MAVCPTDSAFADRQRTGHRSNTVPATYFTFSRDYQKNNDSLVPRPSRCSSLPLFCPDAQPAQQGHRPDLVYRFADQSAAHLSIRSPLIKLSEQPLEIGPADRQIIEWLSRAPAHEIHDRAGECAPPHGASALCHVKEAGGHGLTRGALVLPAKGHFAWGSRPHRVEVLIGNDPALSKNGDAITALLARGVVARTSRQSRDGVQPAPGDRSGPGSRSGVLCRARKTVLAPGARAAEKGCCSLPSCPLAKRQAGVQIHRHDQAPGRRAPGIGPQQTAQSRRREAFLL